jgi:hypothetical protein
MANLLAPLGALPEMIKDKSAGEKHCRWPDQLE